MRLVLFALAAGAVVLWRRRGTDAAHVVVEWRDGAELALGEGTHEHERIVAAAERVIG